MQMKYKCQLLFAIGFIGVLGYFYIETNNKFVLETVQNNELKKSLIQSSLIIRKFLSHLNIESFIKKILIHS